MLTVTRDMILPTTVTGSYPRPLWFDRSLAGRSFKSALGDSLFREQYLDAVASIIAEQEAAGLDIVTDGDSRFDLTVGGKSWFFYPIERLGGIEGHRDTSRGWMSRHGLRPGKILWEVQEAYQPGVVRQEAHARPAGIHRAVEGGAAPDRPAGQVRRHLRAGAGLDAVERVLRRRQGDDPRSLRHHERGVPRAGRRRLPADPGRGAAAPQPRPAGGHHRRRSRVPDRGLQPPARQRQRRDLGAHLLGQSQPAARALEGAELRARPAPPAAAQLRRADHRMRQLRRPGPAALQARQDRQEDRASAWSTIATRWSSRPSTWRR